MPVYSLILFAVAAALLTVGLLVRRGRVRLIHAYHRAHVKDPAAYGREMGAALMLLALPLIAAGVVGLFTASFLPTAVLLAGLALGLIPLFRVQIRHNGSL